VRPHCAGVPQHRGPAHQAAEAVPDQVHGTVAENRDQVEHLLPQRVDRVRGGVVGAARLVLAALVDRDRP